MDDGLKFAGNVGNFYSKLNETVEIVGGEKNVEQLTDENIGVVANKEAGKNGKLDIKLAKNLKKLESAEFTKTVTTPEGDVTTVTTINDKGLTIGTGDKALAITENSITFAAPTVPAGGTSKALTIDGTAGTITGLTNTTWNVDAITSGRAATEDQLKALSETVSGNASSSTDYQLVKAGTTETKDGTEAYKADEKGDITLLVQDKNHKKNIEKIIISDVASKNVVDKMLNEGFTVGEAGQPGKDGKDGTIGVNGKDGSSVVINGKDGSIGMKGKDGANGKLFLQKVPGLDGADGETRMV
ncbi:hypothetical protein C3L56_02715, partial [Veillonellaceae bacterium M2-4]|nr:hypothetical protein [Veillonellaceae bacterium M2-4]